MTSAMAIPPAHHKGVISQAMAAGTEAIAAAEMWPRISGKWPAPVLLRAGCITRKMKQ